MIRTSSHKNWNTDLYLTYAISGNKGKNANYCGRSYTKLAPKLSFWKVWHENIGIIPEEDNNRYYVEEYYNQVLSKLDPEEIYRELDNSVLLCYEDNTEFCHRHIVAKWFEILLGVKIPEVKINNGFIEEIDRPQYIKEYLEDVMIKSKNMKGFNSLRALYLFEKSNVLDQEAEILEEQENKCYDHYRQEACYLRCEADEEESQYNKNKLIKIKKL